MVVSTFFILDKDSRERFFKEDFLLADVKLDTVLGIPFLTINNSDVDFLLNKAKFETYNGDLIALETYF